MIDSYGYILGRLLVDTDLLSMIGRTFRMRGGGTATIRAYKGEILSGETDTGAEWWWFDTGRCNRRVEDERDLMDFPGPGIAAPAAYTLEGSVGRRFRMVGGGVARIDGLAANPDDWPHPLFGISEEFGVQLTWPANGRFDDKCGSATNLIDFPGPGIGPEVTEESVLKRPFADGIEPNHLTVNHPEHCVSSVNHPEHYSPDSVEVIDAIEAWGLGFHLGNAVKYIARAGKKSEDPREDLEKAVWYIRRYTMDAAAEDRLAAPEAGP